MPAVDCATRGKAKQFDEGVEQYFGIVCNQSNEKLLSQSRKAKNNSKDVTPMPPESSTS
jgi:hypothetical protein